MPRKGWSQFDAPSGWVQILGGPRPRAAKWPRASSQHRRQPAVQGQKVSVPPLPQTVSGVAPLQLPSRSPVTVAAEAVAQVKQLSRHRSSRGEQCPCEGPPGRPPRCSEQGQAATDPGSGGVVQDVLRTCTEGGSSSPGCDRQGHRAEGHIRIGGGGGSTQTRGSPGRTCADASTTRDVFNCVGDAGEDQHIGERARRSQIASRPTSLKAVRQVDGRGSSLVRERSTNAEYQRARVGGMDQRPQLRTPQCGGVRRHEFGGQDWTSGWARGQPTRINLQRCDHDRSMEVFRDVFVDRCSGSQTPVHCYKQCVWSSAVMRDSRYGHRGVRIGEAQNPGPPRTRARARMEEEAEIALTNLEAAITRIEDSSDDKPLMPTWRDEDNPCVEVGRGPDVRNVWARVGDIGSRAPIVPTLLDSLGPDNESSSLIPGDVGGPSDDECSSAHSESCWGEMEDIGDDEVPEWGVTYPLSCAESQGGPTRQRETVAASSLPDGVDSADWGVSHPMSAHVEPAPHVLSCDRVAVHTERTGRSKVKRLRLVRHSQREMVAASSPPSSHNGFGVLGDEMDHSHKSGGGHRMLDVVHSPSQSLCDALEFDLTREDSDHSIAATQLDVASLHGNCGPRFEPWVGGTPSSPDSGDMPRNAVHHGCHMCARASRRVVLAPQSEGTPQSVQDVVQSNPSAGAPGLVLPESQMTGDAEQEQVPVILDPDSDSEVDPSVAGDVVVEESDEDQEVVVGLPRGVVLRMALRNLDDVDPRVLFRQRASVMRSVPRFPHRPFRNVLKMALEEATWGNYRQDEVRQERGWKLLELLPRMLLHRDPGGGLISKTKLRARFEAFS